MKDPPRLLDSGSGFERSLLSSSHDEMPSKDLDRRVLAAMAAAPIASAASGSAIARWLSPKSIVAGCAAIALGAIVVGTMLRQDPPAKAPPPSPAATSVAPAVTVATPAPEPPRETVTTVTTPDSLPNAPAPARTAAKAPAPAPTGSASIAREIELLDDVKAKLGAGTPSEAARALDAYDKEFPQGALRPEATVLRIRSLLLAGDRERATKLGEDFIAKNPNGVHAKRVRALLEEK